MPSPPSIGLFQNRKPTAILYHSDIEGTTTEQIATALVDAFERLCSRKRPSISAQKFARLAREIYSSSSNLSLFTKYNN